MTTPPGAAPTPQSGLAIGAPHGNGPGAPTRRCGKVRGRRGRRPGRATALAATALLLTGGAWAKWPDAPARPPGPAANVTAPAAPQQAGAADGVVGLPRAEPVRVRIPALDVDAPLTPLALGAGGELVPPDPAERNLAGWYAAGPAPGEPGTAVITGHADTPTGPAAFFRLGALTPGAGILIDRGDGTVAAFTVDAVAAHPKTAFPTELVYRHTPHPQLRLITCGGTYDPHHGGYQDNTVIYAHLDLDGRQVQPLGR